MVIVVSTPTCDRHRPGCRTGGATTQSSKARDHAAAAADRAVQASVLGSASGGHGVSMGAVESVALWRKSAGQTAPAPSIVRAMGWRRRIKVRSGSLLGPYGVVAERVTWCVTLKDRLRGVIGREPLAPNEAYVIAGSRQVHTVGVPYALDAIFCDGDFQVLHVQTLRPQSRSKRIRDAQFCVEVAGGRATDCGITAGVQLRFGGEA
jgi:uncharacterized membrane protein (UPF0127 family)